VWVWPIPDRGVPDYPPIDIGSMVVGVDFTAVAGRHGQPAPEDTSCHCLCGIHKSAGMFCAGVRAWTVTLLTEVVPPSADVPLCGPCATWWVGHHSDRVVQVRAVD
jgi:hypothetical protein